MKYIDAEKLIAEIAMLREEHTTREYRDEAALVLDDLEDYVDSLQEQPKVDFTVEIKILTQSKEWEEMKKRGTYMREALYIVARHFYELGLRRAAEMYDEIEYNRQRAEEESK